MKLKYIIPMIAILSMLVSGYTAPSYGNVEIEIGAEYTAPSYGNVEIEIGGAVAGPSDSCTYSSGDWVVDCSDNCQISSAVDLGGNNIIVKGTGTFTITSAVTGYGQLKVVGTDSSNKCFAKCIDCIK